MKQLRLIGLSSLLLLALAMVATTGYAQQTPNLQVGMAAPDITGTLPDGKQIALKELLKRGPVILVFYRGQWCPYCTKYMRELQLSTEKLERGRAQLLAVSPESEANILKTREKTGVTYPILHDQGHKIMDAYGVTFAMDAERYEKMKTYGLDNAENGAVLPIPATYVIGQDGKIRYMHFDPDYKQRPTIETLQQQIEKQ